MLLSYNNTSRQLMLTCMGDHQEVELKPANFSEEDSARLTAEALGKIAECSFDPDRLFI